MTIFQAMVLGTVQGLTEILPISSSAHLTLIPWLFHWEDPGLAFDVALHMGTLLALAIYFFTDWADMLTAAWKNPSSKAARLFWQLVVATIPAAVAGLILEKYAETLFRTPALIATTSIIFAIWLDLADQKGIQKIRIEETSFTNALLIGLSQALAIIPGVSRSGVTITAGLWEGMTRESAARFSFLLSTPIIFGAGLHQLRHLQSADFQAPFWVGVGSSFIASLLTIRSLMAWLKHSNFRLFTIYRITAGVAVLALCLAQ